MSRTIHNILKGIGRAIDLSPPTDYSQYVPKIDYNASHQYGANQTDAEKLYNDWVKVGGYLRHAMSIVDKEIEKKDGSEK
ncbi:MAG: hypothetical protein HQL01_12300 [Nitrospirae bacterium]|nr:hypothetical protein [Nitrospirota bacterium]